MRLGKWLRSSRAGLFLLAVTVGIGAGLGAVGFRYLISLFTWIATGHADFGQDGRIVSAHLPWLGPIFYLVIPAIGGLLYGPLVNRFAHEARGHGVPEVMVAVAEQGGRIRPQVTVVKALASALTIGTGGSVGREGPIVQIGSAMASTLGQRVRMPERRMRVLVACGAGGAIAATFNAPITGVFFAVEIILRELGGEALFAVMLSAMVADAVAIPMLGNEPFLAQFPRGAALHHAATYLLVGVLAVVAALVGQLFRMVLYGIEDLFDKLWGNRPEWARPAVGGILVGALLLAVPQLFGVGYPVMFKAVAGDYALWFVVVLVFGKILATSLTLGVGGSGGVFGPSLFIGLMTGIGYGQIVHQLFGASAGNPGLYAAVGMAAVVASATRAPLMAFASVVEMTGDYGLTLPVMLAAAVSTAIARSVSYGTIYSTKLLRRGQDIERTAPWRAFADLTAAGAMRPLRTALELPDHKASSDGLELGFGDAVVTVRDPQVVFESESLVEVLRHLERHHREGLAVLSEDARRIVGWVTNASILHTVGRQLAASPPPGEVDEPETVGRSALPGYRVIEISVAAGSGLAGRELHTIAWPQGAVPASVIRDERHRHADGSIVLRAGDRVGLLARA